MLTSELTEEAIAQIKRDKVKEQHAGHFQKPIPDFTITRPRPGRLASAWDGWIMYDWYPWMRYYYNEVQVDVVVIPHSDLTNLWPYADLDDEERHAFLEELQAMLMTIQMHAPIERPVLTFKRALQNAQPTEMLLTLKNEVDAWAEVVGIQDWNKKFAGREVLQPDVLEKLDLEVYRMRFTGRRFLVDIDTIFDTRIGWAKVFVL
ncbi:putative virion structural protein [Salmonella phage SPFM1]|nr:putative virion structural protein [Salmonella phage SPFM1]